jgi:membrane associated rhomboid family serine protease
MYEENQNKVIYRFSWGGKMTAVVFSILIVTGVIFLVQLITGNKVAGADLAVLFGVSAAAFRPWQLITSAFLHSTSDPFHILFNMLLLWLLGKDVERAIGARKFIALYLAGAVASGLCWIGIEALQGSGVPAIGASGAIFAVLVAYAILYPDRRFFFIKATYFVIAIIAIEVLLSVVDSNGDVAHVAHVGGAGFGFLFFKGAPAWDGMLRRYRRRRSRHAHQDEGRIRAKVDALLDKISRDGLDSLTDGEKAFLKKASRRFKQHRSSTDTQYRDFLRRK